RIRAQPATSISSSIGQPCKQRAALITRRVLRVFLYLLAPQLTSPITNQKRTHNCILEPREPPMREVPSRETSSVQYDFRFIRCAAQNPSAEDKTRSCFVTEASPTQSPTPEP